MSFSGREPIFVFWKGNAIDGGDSSSVQDELKDVPWSIWAVYGDQRETLGLQHPKPFGNT